MTMATALQEIPLRRINGDQTSLGDFAGKVLLIVNTASKCGLTPQYEGLEKLYEQYAGRGLVVLGFPANDFAGQEPGSDEEIQTFCQTNYDVSFPLFSKVAVTGESKHPLYRQLTEAQPSATGADPNAFRDRLVGYGIKPSEAPDVLWNFEKFLVSREGKVVARFTPDTSPDDPLLISAIEGELAKA
jgi:glutathione peroxidase